MNGNDLAAVAAEAAKGTSKPAAETKPATAPAPAQQQQPTAPAAQPPAAAAAPVVADLDAARAEGRRAAMAEVAEIHELCALAGCPARAAEFISAKTSVADVRKALLESRAQADAGRRIDTQHAGTGTTGTAPGKGALAARMTQLVKGA